MKGLCPEISHLCVILNPDSKSSIISCSDIRRIVLSERVMSRISHLFLHHIESLERKVICCGITEIAEEPITSLSIFQLCATPLPEVPTSGGDILIRLTIVVCHVCRRTNA